MLLVRCSRTGCIRASKNSSILNFLGTHISMPIILYYHCNVGLEVRPICDVGLESRPNIIRFPILLCHISFQLHCHHLLRAGGLFHFKKYVCIQRCKECRRYQSRHGAECPMVRVNQCIFYTFTCDMPFHAGQALYQGRSRNCPSWAGGCFP